MQNDPFDDLGLGPSAFDPSGFAGIARLFPLPAPSLFPRVVLPLHVFEGRYRALMQDALDGDGLIAMAVLQPGWETDYASRPPLEPHACLGQIVTHHQLPDGRYNLLLAGVSRVRLIEEVEPPQAFRRARVELVEDQEPPDGEQGFQDLRRRLLASLQAALPASSFPKPLLKQFEEESPLGLLADLAAYTLPLDREVKQAMLAEPSAQERAVVLIEAISSLESENTTDRDDPPGFPPPFSEN